MLKELKDIYMILDSIVEKIVPNFVPHCYSGSIAMTSK